MAAWDEMEECFSARCNWEWSRRSEAERSDMGPGRGASSSFFSFWGRGEGGGGWAYWKLCRVGQGST